MEPLTSQNQFPKPYFHLFVWTTERKDTPAIQIFL